MTGVQTCALPISVRFATADEVLTLTTLRPGSIPPFGSLFSLPTYCDPALSDNERINFNAGTHGDSLQMTYAAWAGFERPTMLLCAKPAECGEAG